MEPIQKDYGGERVKKAAGILFFFAWLMCGCSVDQMLDDWRAGWTAVVALIVAITCAIAMSGKGK